MSAKASAPESGAHERALDVWLDFLAAPAGVGDEAFEQLCERFPELAAELRSLRARAREGTPAPAHDSREEPTILERIQRLAQPLSAGQRYQREAVIARGGMGVIHRVKDVQLERTLALKEMAHRPTEIDSLAAARFYEEAQITSQLDHPGIVPVHECGVDDNGHLFFAMKFVQGRDLRAILELVTEGKEGWTQTRALGALLKVCDAMAYAHAKGVIHRDLKPGNVMVGSFGEVYVMDWGLARVTGRRDLRDLRIQPPSATASLHTARREEREATPDSPLLTMDGEVVGTPAYMPPEQAMGQVELLSPRSDVYSVGAILYQLLTGEVPYVPPGSRMHQHTVLSRVIDGPPRPVTQLSPDAPRELVAICETAMARKPEDRYADMQALRDDLRAYLEGRVVKAYGGGVAQVLAKWVHRNAFACGSALVILVLACAVSFGFFLDARGSKKLAEQLAEMPRVDDLITQTAALWPITPEQEPALVAWLEEAEAVYSRIAAHESTLAGLQGSSGVETRWWSGQLEKLIAELKVLGDPERGVIAGISPAHGWGITRRLEFSRTMTELSLTGERAAPLWKEALAAIADEDGPYRGLRIAPQLGLLPLGADPESGLWEFAHLLSGEAPKRDQDGLLNVRESTCIVLVLVPGDTFEMGVPDGAPGANEASTPRHPVTLEPFFLSKYETTEAQWMRFTGTNPSRVFTPPVPRTAPVQQVSWDECREQARRFGLTLPTEAQWEHAARGGKKETWWTGDDPTFLEGVANLCDRSFHKRDNNPDVPYEDWLDDGAS
jgi:tRNA A-37 threonylcarbamoyl transferase component Bud32